LLCGLLADCLPSIGAFELVTVIMKIVKQTGQRQHECIAIIKSSFLHRVASSNATVLIAQLIDVPPVCLCQWSRAWSHSSDHHCDGRMHAGTRRIMIDHDRDLNEV
jgi:hypothetical protein